MSKVSVNGALPFFAGVFVLLMFPFPRGFAQGVADSLQAQVDRYEQRLIEVQRKQQRLAPRVEKAAQKVARLKEGRQTPLTRHRLESALRELQALADSAEAAENEHHHLQAALDTVLAHLWAHYDAEISRMTKVFADAGTKLSEDERRARVEAIAALRRKRAEVSARMAGVPAALDSLPAWATTAEDDYRRLEDKATLLQERAARVRREAQGAEKRLRQLRDELLLRERLNELVKEVVFLDQQDETVRRAGARGAAEGVLPTSYEAADIRAATGASASYAAPMAVGRLWTADPSQLSTAEAERFIDQLETVRARLLAMADTLATRAQLLAQKAALLRAQQSRSVP